MMLSVNTNPLNLSSTRQLTNNQLTVSRGLERLSTGLRVNGARDDAAGLSISTRMTSQVRGINQTIRNANDSVSLMQTADGALEESTQILHRMRELAVQAGNEILSESDRVAVQAELEALKSELNKINEGTVFNGGKVFSQHNTVTYNKELDEHYDSKYYNFIYEMSAPTYAGASVEHIDEIEYNLKTSWLREAEERLDTYYGLHGDGKDVIIDFIDNGDYATPSAWGVLAYVLSSDPQRFEIDLEDFTDDNQPNGGVDYRVYSDRVVVHEFTHLVMNSNNIRQDGAYRWFNEGVSELIHGGADSRLGLASDADLQNYVNLAFGTSPISYEGAYTSAAYLHQEIKSAGGTGMRDFFDELKSNGNDFDAALAATTNYTGAAFAGDVYAEYKDDFANNGLNFAKNLRDQSNATGDTGAIGGAILDGGEVLTAESVLPNEPLDPILDDRVIQKRGGVSRALQTGTGSEDSSQFTMTIGSFNTNAMRLTDLDVINHSNVNSAIDRLDEALEYVSAQRAELGATQVRFESMVNSLNVAMETTSASRGRIADADYATEATALTQAQIVQQASVSLLAQANALPTLSLALLN